MLDALNFITTGLVMGGFAALIACGVFPFLPWNTIARARIAYRRWQRRAP